MSASSRRRASSGAGFTGASRRRAAGWLLVLGLGCGLAPARPSRAAELILDFAAQDPGPPPASFRSALTGDGPAPEWRVIQVESASALPAAPGEAPGRTTEKVLAQLSQDTTDERFPLLIYENERFADFTATLRFRTVSGRTEQMAGLAFRLVDERNYYVVRVSSLGNNIRFYKFVDGVRSEPIGPELRVPVGAWHTLQVICKGNSIRARLDDRDAIPALTDVSFARGRIAFWTKSDSVSHFARLHLDYDLVKTLPQRIVDQAREKYPRLLGLTVFARDEGSVLALAATDPSAVGRAGGGAEERALTGGEVSASSSRNQSVAVLPVRDRNGDPLFALRFTLRSFPGQTEANVAARARIMAEELEGLVRAAEAANEPGSGAGAPPDAASGSPRKN